MFIETATHCVSVIKFLHMKLFELGETGQNCLSLFMERVHIKHNDCLSCV